MSCDYGDTPDSEQLLVSTSSGLHQRHPAYEVAKESVGRTSSEVQQRFAVVQQSEDFSQAAAGVNTTKFEGSDLPGPNRVLSYQLLLIIHVFWQ